jgi:signal transduction histidine kinase
VADLLESIRQVAAAARRRNGVALSIEVDAGIPQLLVDRLQIELVLRNLVSNALEAVETHTGRDGAITVTAKRDDPQHVRIVVADNGPGVPAATAERLFEPFVSGKSSGMGLGLAVSRAIAEAHGGTLEARAAAHGEFHLVLPLSAEHV